MIFLLSGAQRSAVDVMCDRNKSGRKIEIDEVRVHYRNNMVLTKSRRRGQAKVWSQKLHHRLITCLAGAMSGGRDEGTTGNDVA
jgi:hypothetical protein